MAIGPLSNLGRSVNFSSIIGGLIFSMLVGGFLLFRYWISKNVTIYVQTTGGATLGLSFSRSIIEGVALDAKQALNAIMVINRLIQHARGLGSDHDDMGEFEAKPKRPPVRVAVERD